MVDLAPTPYSVIFLQLILATFLGGILGLEREYRKKEAGLRTYSLVSLGSAFFTIISIEFSKTAVCFAYTKNITSVSFDPSRIVGQIVVGIGFLGAGLIIFRGFHIEGLTTAAGLWVAGAIGTAVGAHLYIPAIFVTFLGILILAGLGLIERKFLYKGVSRTQDYKNQNQKKESAD